MTVAEIDQMPAGREMDALIAEKVMKWLPHSRYRSYYVDAAVADSVGSDFVIQECIEYWNPSTDIAAAWRVHQEMCHRLFSVRRAYFAALGGLLTRQVLDETGEVVRVAWPDALKFLSPGVICRAAFEAANGSQQ
jgi:hypothetical protein